MRLDLLLSTAPCTFVCTADVSLVCRFGLKSIRARDWATGGHDASAAFLSRDFGGGSPAPLASAPVCAYKPLTDNCDCDPEPLCRGKCQSGRTRRCHAGSGPQPWEPWQCTTHRGILQRETAPGTHPLRSYRYCVLLGGGFSALGEGRVQSQSPCVSVSQGSPQRAERASPTRKMEPYSINVFYHPHLRGRPRWLRSAHHCLVMPHMSRY